MAKNRDISHDTAPLRVKEGDNQNSVCLPQPPRQQGLAVKECNFSSAYIELPITITESVQFLNQCLSLNTVDRF